MAKPRSNKEAPGGRAPGPRSKKKIVSLPGGRATGAAADKDLAKATAIAHKRRNKAYAAAYKNLAKDRWASSGSGKG